MVQEANVTRNLLQMAGNNLALRHFGDTPDADKAPREKLRTAELPGRDLVMHRLRKEVRKLSRICARHDTTTFLV